MADIDFKIFKNWQSLLVTQLQVPIEELRALRKKVLTEGTDWVRDGNRVLLSDEGVKKIRASLHLPAAAPSPEATPGAGTTTTDTPEPTAQKEAGGGLQTQEEPKKRRVFEMPPPPKRLEELTELVVYRTVANPRILEAHAPNLSPDDRRNILRVQVRSSANFRRGMKVPVRFVQAPDLFEHNGREPRWIGKY